MARSFAVARVLARASVLGSLQYRAEFFFDAVRSVFDAAWTLVPLLVVFGARATIAGWNVNEALLVTAWFTLLKALLEGIMTPSLVSTIEQIRRGTFDFVLVKPVDAQLWASVGKIEISSASDLVVGAAMGTVALVRLHHLPTIAQGCTAALLTLSGIAILYALNVLALSVAFFVARIDNLAYLLAALFDAARWPAGIFSGGMRVFFTFVLPLGLMTTYPPLALLGRLDGRSVFVALGVAALALVVARLVWLRSLAAYRSGGG
jgi:ABC-2 type transport system permease protein